MDIVKFAENKLGLKLSYLQQDLLTILATNPEPLIHCLKPKTHDVRLVLAVYEKWKETQSVVC